MTSDDMLEVATPQRAIDTAIIDALVEQAELARL